jgi:uncharacterized membrane protein/uncharacterized protein YegL
VNLRFDQPGLLWLALLLVPLVVASWRALVTQDRLRRSVVLLLRSALLLALVVCLAGPRLEREHHHVTVIGVLDLSGSVKQFAQLPETDDEAASLSAVEYLRNWFRQATRTKAPDDRFGLVVFDGKATVVSVPVKGDYVDDNLDVTIFEGTNIAEAIGLALAMFPAETARRIVLVSDGNETAGSALEAARQAAAAGQGVASDGARLGVPIDVVPIVYSLRGDVQLARLEVPPTAQAGQAVTARIVLEATRSTRGRLSLLLEGAPVDINGARPGHARDVEVPEGRSVHLAQVVLGQTPINRFEAVFEPEALGDDVLETNNRAEAFTATPSRGLVLVVDPAADERASLLAETLTAAEIPAEAAPPHRVPTDLLSLQRYDLIILDNVSASVLEPQQHELLSRWVHDFGGGFVMVGGDQGFGAGGWNGTALEAVLPVELDPPRELKLATAALVLVLDKSGSMGQPVAGTRSSQQRVANEAAATAIESLRSESLVGVVTFDFGARVRVPLQPNEDPQRIAQSVRGITPDGGTNLEPALRTAHKMLAGVETKKKLVVCLTDGQSPGADLDSIARRMAADDIKLTTIAIGDQADHATLKRLAELGGGEFHPVYNPRALPRVLVDSVQVINKPLLKEVPFTPVVLPTGSTLTAGMTQAPVLDGLVITTPRPEPGVVVEMTHVEGEPLLAHWQVGLGRAAAFTSDSGAQWAHRWVEWPGYGAFWTQLARTMSRPAASPDTELLVRIDGGRLHIVLEATDQQEGYLDYLHVDGDVYAPSGRQPVRLRQTAPGSYETTVDAIDPGNYIVALSPRRGTRRLSPVIGGVTQPLSVEYRRYDADARLLEKIVGITGGRSLDLADPSAVDLFDRGELPVSRSALPAWNLVLWAALALLLLDVAGRRLAWDAGLLRRAAARALARVRPGHARGREAMATLASLRRVTAQVEDRLPTRGAAVPEEPARAKPPEAKPAGKPAPARIGEALDTILRRGRPEPPPPEAEEEPEEEREPGTATTSSLLEARRRRADAAKRRTEGSG